MFTHTYKRTELYIYINIWNTFSALFSISTALFCIYICMYINTYIYTYKQYINIYNVSIYSYIYIYKTINIHIQQNMEHLFSLLFTLGGRPFFFIASRTLNCFTTALLHVHLQIKVHIYIYIYVNKHVLLLVFICIRIYT